MGSLIGRTALVGFTAGITVAACSSDPSLTGPGEPCTSFVTSFELAEPSEMPSNLEGSISPTCLPLMESQADAGLLTCSFYATLGGPGDESVCETSGLITPDASDIAQIVAGYAADGFDASMNPTCLVPRLVGADLDDAGSCDASPMIGWCLAPLPGCPFALRFSPELHLGAAEITIACDLCGGSADL